MNDHNAVEAPPWWGEVLEQKDAMSLAKLAALVDVPVATIAAEMKRRGVKRTPASDATTRQGSKDSAIARHAHLLGNVPDSEVARLSEVSVRTVASYRARHNIPGYRGPRRKPQRRGRRESKVGDFRALIGVVPDRVVAEVSGMSLGAVRNFRIKEQIPPAGRMRPAEIATHVEGWQSQQGGATSEPDAAATTDGLLGADSTASFAWRVELAGNKTSGVIVAADWPGAVRAALASASESEIAAIHRIGPVLG